MGSIFNDDFRDFIRALNDNQVEYILVGGYAVILHGYRRVTGDMDVWVNRTKENYLKLTRAFGDFGLPLFDMTESNFLNLDEADVFSFGRPPVGIDILTNLKGVDFKEAYALSQIFIDGDLEVRYLHLNNLIAAKKAAGRHKDLDDIEKLTAS
jgi:predicted nucleotidyltransferase